ncbi:phosphomannomutase/phosphoglucomutase [Patescibacteria group bacterium]|nr:phosphomannomutase/phosphoglucomutase [Patescibacteria group bacterium]MBU1730219.1 phosphomannomutase/phosphoglucomutase [Patescibacteria group bacterium]MBU1956351.1 phosphomannomutase/phosphoglucomutase [Patescibacteria group bacterium]MBU2009967.1 phosphomannomutase/phosphoglucomutase [Patescibacteria group bacterium]MBU2416664.1 phosphomannomutase/phosphoglucomutase [Patescibacteria group bacterium]
MLASIFKKYDIRGEYPTKINEEVAFSIGQVYADYLKSNDPKGTPNKVIVGRDIRLSSEELSVALINGIISTGIDVLNIGLASSPHYNYASAHFNLPAILITASHMTKNFNGFKFVFSGNTILTDQHLAKIKEVALSDIKIPTSKASGIVENTTILEEYIKEIRQFIKTPFKKLKIVMDAGNAMAGLSLEKIFEDTGLEIIPLYTTLDGNFPNHETNPKIAKNQIDLKRKIVEEKADLGFMFDGDADRFYAFDRSGDVIFPSYISALMGRYLIRNYPGNEVVVEVRTSNVVRYVVEKAGGKVLVTKPWHIMIKLALTQNPDAVLGSETSGHYIFRDFYKIDDGILAAVVFLQAISNEEKSVDDILDEFRKKYFIIEETNFQFDNKTKQDQKLAEVENYYKNQSMKIEKIDGISMSFDNWHFNLRSSETDPVLRLNMEANSKELMEKKCKELADLIQK